MSEIQFVTDGSFVRRGVGSAVFGILRNTLLASTVFALFAPSSASAYRTSVCQDGIAGVRSLMPVHILQCRLPEGSAEFQDVAAGFAVWNKIVGVRNRFTMEPGHSRCEDIEVKAGRVQVWAANNYGEPSSISYRDDLGRQGGALVTRARTRRGCSRDAHGDSIAGQVTGATVTIYLLNTLVESAPRGSVACYDYVGAERPSLRTQVAHEAGHIMGLNHTPHSTNSLMHPDFGRGSPGALYCTDLFDPSLRLEHSPTADDSQFAYDFHREEGAEIIDVGVTPFFFSEYFDWIDGVRSGGRPRTDGGGHLMHRVLVMYSSMRAVPERVCPVNRNGRAIRGIQWGTTVEVAGNDFPSTVQLEYLFRRVRSGVLDVTMPYATLPAPGRFIAPFAFSWESAIAEDSFLRGPVLSNLPPGLQCGEQYDVLLSGRVAASGNADNDEVPIARITMDNRASCDCERPINLFRISTLFWNLVQAVRNILSWR